MADAAPDTALTPMEKALRGQGRHLLAYLAIGAVLLLAASQLADADDRAWGRSAFTWVTISWVLAGLHQAWVAFFWRSELYLGQVRAWLGEAGFPVYRAGFFVLGPARLLTVVPISLATEDTLPIPRALAVALIVVSTPFILWTFWSFLAYLGMDRAVGADHFDPAWRGASLETRGIFRYVRNPAYAVGLLILYHAGLVWMSGLGLVAAAAHHAFVWCHYLCSERPDMREIYGEKAVQPGRYGI